MVGADICSGMSRPTGRNELAPIKELKGTEEQRDSWEGGDW